jgi:hypothetical protein
MPLKLRPTGLGSGIDKDRPDYGVYSGEWWVGRIYQTRGGPESSALVLVHDHHWSVDALRSQSSMTPIDQSQLGAFPRSVTSFNALDRSNTGSAKNTPKSDMDLLARIQHLASLNWASHRMVAKSPTSRARGPGARSRMFIGILLSPTAVSYECRSGEGDGPNIGGALVLMIRDVATRPWHRKNNRPELFRTAIRAAA